MQKDSINTKNSLNVKEDESLQEVKENLTNIKSETYKGSKSKKSNNLKQRQNQNPYALRLGVK